MNDRTQSGVGVPSKGLIELVLATKYYDLDLFENVEDWTPDDYV